MRMILAVIVVLVVGVNPHWQKYKAEKIAAYQAQHGGDVCEVNNVLIGVECRPFTRAERETKEQAEALQRWNDRVADAEARKRVAQQMEDLLHYGQ
ncbi:MAG: hypothetical protein ACRC7D_22245 [Aeromonas popoffii]|uniref:hypothetical protein n=1 Tax=Aeromonas popoffii TaxID=70856 RepID=UPI003F35C423